MRDFPSCFGERGVQIADYSPGGAAGGKNAQNLVTCHYRAAPLPGCRGVCAITVTWSKSLMGGLGFSVGVDGEQCLGKLDIKPWLFAKRKGFKSLEAGDSRKVDVFWDLSAARYASSPEPLDGFYVAVIVDLEMVLLLGDLAKEAYRKTGVSLPPSNATLVVKKEHIFGKKVYCTRAQFCENGQVHNIVIECEAAGLKDPSLEIRIDKKLVMQVKRLGWKFRGNQTILVDGLPVEVFWDVHSWLFGAPAGSAVFMFQTCLSVDKLMPWSCTQLSGDAQLQGLGFSLILHAWKSE